MSALNLGILAPPGDWRFDPVALGAVHPIRTFLSIAVMVAGAISVAVTPRPGEPLTDEDGAQGGRRGGGRRDDR